MREENSNTIKDKIEKKKKERKITTGIKKDNCITETKSQKRKKETETYRYLDMYKRKTYKNRHTEKEICIKESHTKT